jgi:Ca2+-binding RTX toxin-like protein
VNHVTVATGAAPDTWLVTDTGAPLSAGPGCTTIDPNSAFCVSPLSDSERSFVSVTLEDGNDWGSTEAHCHEFSFPECDAEIEGGTGNDVLIGVGDDFLFGGPGNDK